MQPIPVESKKRINKQVRGSLPGRKKETFLNKRSEELVRNSPPIKRKKEKARKRFLKVSPKFFFCFGRKKIGIVFSGVSVRSELFGRSLFLLFRNFFSSSVHTLKNEPVCDS